MLIYTNLTILLKETGKKYKELCHKVEIWPGLLVILKLQWQHQKSWTPTWHINFFFNKDG